MITENNIKHLENLVAKYAMKDYKRANPKPKRNRDGSIKHNPYTLSPLTNEAREMLQLARKENITTTEEEIVKAYLLKNLFIGDNNE